MAAELTQAIPSPDHPLVDRYLKPSPVWYPWLRKVLDFINGIASGELIVDGAITARTIAAGAITADAIAANAITSAKIAADAITADKIAAGAVNASEIAAGAITTDKLSVDNLDVLNGTFGDLRTNTTGTRIQITDAENELRCYIGGTLVATVGADVITRGGFLSCTSPSAAWYPATLGNTSSAGGALYCTSIGGYTIEAGQSSSASNSYAGNFRNTSGGHAAIGGSSGGGGYAGLAVSGTWFPFTGSHPGLLAKSETPEVGDILVDGAVVARSIDDVICYATRSTSPNQTTAIGVYTHRYALDDNMLMPALGLKGAGTSPVLPPDNWTALKDGYDACTINALGEGCINVCAEGGNISAGDLIVTSSRPGKGMRQVDDLLRAATVARAREAITFTHPDEIRLCACIYLAG